MQAKQVVIDALVLEIDSEKVSELGIKYSTKTSPLELEFSQANNPKGTFTMSYDKTLLSDTLDFNTKLEALVSSQEATILSRPSVIVLDGSHRYIFFLMNGFEEVPVKFVDYNDEHIRVGSRLIHRYLVDGKIEISKKEVLRRGINGELFPPRTTRHFFPFRKNERINVSIDSLK